MDVLFVITNINGTYDDTYSFGLASIASIARDKGFDYDYAVINTPGEYEGFLALVGTMKPDIIAYTSVSSQFMYVRDLSKKVRDIHNGAVIQVCGGVHTTLFPESALEAEGLDGVFVGEGELAFSDFLDRVSEGRPYKDVRNFAYNDNGNLVVKDLYPLITSLDELPFPERGKFDYQRYVNTWGYAGFLFSRGCPYHCTYCSNPAMAEVYNIRACKPRYRSPDGCVEEIQQAMERYAFRRVYLLDDTFGVDRKWLKEFCIRYPKAINLPFGVNLRVNLVDEEMMEYLKQAGCGHVQCGVESGSDYIRNRVLKRAMKREQIIKAYSLFKKYGFTSNAINMIGLPHETEDNIWETIKLNREINPTFTYANIFYPYRGTELGDYCFANGLVDEELYQGFSKERRDTVLRFDEDFRRKLLYFHRNWSFLVYRFRPLKLVSLLRTVIAGYMKRRFPRLWSILRDLKTRVKRSDFLGQRNRW